MAAGSTALYVKARGLRNNNPLNIRWDGRTQWQGQAGADDGGFIVFESPEYGYRAGRRILANYSARGIDDLQGIVTTWAPPNENDTGAYVDHVVKRLQKEIGPHVTRTFKPVTDLEIVELFKVMTRHENGLQPYSTDLVLSGVQMA